MVCCEIVIRPERSPPRIAAIGASSVGCLSIARPGSAMRKLLTQETSGYSRITWRNDRMIPIKSTAPISALSPGLAKNAAMICLYSTTVTSAHSIRNTTIRTRKIRGEDNLLNSISIAERE